MDALRQSICLGPLHDKAEPQEAEVSCAGRSMRAHCLGYLASAGLLEDDAAILGTGEIAAAVFTYPALQQEQAASLQT